MKFTEQPLSKTELTQRAHEYQNAIDTESGVEQQFLLVFSLGGQWFAFSSHELQEAIPLQPITSLPHTHSTVAGILNLRGHLLLTFDLRLLFEMPKSTESEKIIVTDQNSHLTGFIVDSIEGISAFEKNSFQLNIQISTGVDPLFIQGVSKYQNSPLLWLSVDKILEHLEHFIN